ncbi:MAG: M67 family metallopeptidase [Planctomycetota bacterium]|jgi:proteasome lid subunit RPN8/RPN11
MFNLEIPNIIFEQMIAQIKAEAPIEACGILAGSDNRVEKLYKMTNAEKLSDHFMMEPTEQFKVVKDIRGSGLEMLAIYHSHPQTPARPSSEDNRLALTPNVTHIIVSLQNGDHPIVKGFLMENGSLTEVPVQIVEQ